MVNLMFHIFLVLFCGFLIAINPTFAQTEDIALGGKALCVVSGKSPVKRFIADANRLLILQAEGISKGSIQLQLIQDSKQSLVDINILALLGQIDDVDLFFGGNKTSFESDTSEVSLKKTIKKNNLTVEVNNSNTDELFFPVSGKIRLTSPDQVTANGTLNLKVSNSSALKIKDLEELNPSGVNGSFNIRCKLQDVPIEIKDLLSNI